ncbi:cobyrinic acid a,c-diamide synthase [candidate division LCP-89 bacterium B3_LCP]|uniref:Cobyrinate a,c-diamide synthase n=1 Tax=candidate division LCP-89 bacterium B3_LCP TaxID=2012998 RepID=A0A532V0V0_UNCL8|nr:MAG: cobyrinic acid a,c-diamide synthase [candidate division LCP-89 bacterium B3_LCP]
MVTTPNAARIIIAGTGGDSGKTFVSMGLCASWRHRGYKVATFKKGPDYIDAAWLSYVSGFKTRNLDTYMMGAEGVLHSFHRNCLHDGINLIEGNRGLFDGFDSRGTHSTAELAKLLKTPVVLVLNVTKVTRSAAAVVLGFLKLDPDVKIAGVIINRIGGSRHEDIVRRSIEEICGIPVVGAIPRIKSDHLLPGRHLGLVTPEEHAQISGLNDEIRRIIEDNVDIDRIGKFAEEIPALDNRYSPETPAVIPSGKARIAYFYDSSFTFYYQDNLEALQGAGAELIPISSLESQSLPDCDGLYIGGGFPETHAVQLSQNRSLLESVRKHASAGLPIYAECGGLIFLCRSIEYEKKTYSFANIFPVDLEITPRPQGHGYMEVEVDSDNPYFPLRTKICGHEFHYSRVKSGQDPVGSIFSVKRGQGCFSQRDGLIYKNVLASYLHIHAAGVPQWAGNLVDLASRNKNRK